MSKDEDSLLKELEQLLESERRALISGDFEELTRLHESKSKLVEDLNGSTTLDGHDIGDIRKKMDRNHNLLAGAMDGIRSVADRMSELRQIRQSLSTYDRQGRRKEIRTSSAQKLERRA